MSGLCQLATDFRGSMPTGGMMAEPKCDGFRAMRFPGVDGVVRLWTRGGLPIEGTSHILNRLASMEAEAGETWFFDGEWQVDGSLSATKAWFERGWKLGGCAGIFHLFDGMPYREWRAGGSDVPLYMRKARLRELLAASEDESDGWTWREGSKGAAVPIAVEVLADGWVFDAAHVEQEVARVWAAGGEGLMLKDAESLYRRNRCAAWQKVTQANAHKWARHPIAA